MERYCVAAAQAKTKGDQRKARMHERIVKVCGDKVGELAAPRNLAQEALTPTFPAAIPRCHPSPQGWPSRGCGRAACAPR